VDDIDQLLKRAEALLMQSKKHQIFKEKKEEAAKQSEAASIYMKVASLYALDDQEAAVAESYEAAATCLSRAKRLCRDVIRGKE
jgi:SepF-like predicted cell division protein (DUF552 family)